MKKIWTGVLVAAATALLAACGGGGGAGGITGTGGGNGGITGTGVSFGGITAFGSVWVNGVEFNSDGTTFHYDDRAGVTQSDLRVGMVVRVDGSIDDKKAATITVDDSIKGRVDSVLNANQFVVNGQTVQYDDTTHLEDLKTPGSPSAPGKDDFVEVHGLVVAGGTVNSTFVRKLNAAPSLFEAKGIVTSQDTAAKTFVIGSLTVNYAGATVDNSMPAGSWVGLLVEAKATSCASPCTTLVATKVEPSGARLTSADDSKKAEVEGYVTSGTAASFVLGTQQVVTNGSTVYEGGVAADLAVGVKLEAEGPVSGGVLTASKISFRDGNRFEGDVLSYNANSGALTLAGLPGVTVKVNNLTALKNTTLGSLAIGNHVRIRGKLASGNTVNATELEVRSGSSTRLEIQSAVTAITGTSSFTLLGIAVNTGTVSTFKDVNDNVIDATRFYAALKVGTIAKARGTWNGASVTWTEVQLEQ